MFFFLQVIFSTLTVAFATENETPIIGVVVQELPRSLQEEFPAYSSFIAASYVKAVESSGARVVPIATFQNETYYRNLLNSINGVVLPGGSSLNGPGHPYYDTCSKIYKISKEINDAGKPFPILAVCLGYEFMITIDNNDKNFLMKCNIDYENLPLNFSVPYEQTSLFSRLTQQQYATLNSSNVTVNHHKWCALMSDFLSSSLKDWTITSTSTSMGGLEFTATVEHKKYPFFGIQFHPEKIAFEWNLSHHFPHSEEALIANRYFYDILVHYSRQNMNTFSSARAEKRSLIYNYPTQIPSDGIYEQIYLF